MDKCFVCGEFEAEALRRRPYWETDNISDLTGAAARGCATCRIVQQALEDLVDTDSLSRANQIKILRSGGPYPGLGTHPYGNLPPVFEAQLRFEADSGIKDDITSVTEFYRLSGEPAVFEPRRHCAAMVLQAANLT
jgi:hypothetical protein